MLAQETIIKDSSNFINQHGFTAFLLVLVLLSIAYFIWKVWSFSSPLFSRWVETNITTTYQNANSLELIGSAVSAMEKTNELLIAEIRGTTKQITDLRKDLTEVRDHILAIENRTK